MREFIAKYWKIGLFFIIGFALGLTLMSCQGLINVNGSDNGVAVVDSLK